MATPLPSCNSLFLQVHVFISSQVPPQMKSPGKQRPFGCISRSPFKLGSGEGCMEAQASALFGPFRWGSGGLPCSPPPQALLPLQSSCSTLPSPGLQMRASGNGPQRPMQGERQRHEHVGLHSGPGMHAASSLRPVKCLAKVKCSRNVCSHTEGRGPGSEANSWPFPREPAPFPVQCPRWGHAWDAQHLSRTGKDKV